jgi:hypothetical protein
VGFFQEPGLAIVRYRTSVDRFRTEKMAKKALVILFSHLAPMSISLIWRGSPGKNTEQIQRMAQILLLEKDVKN